MRKNPFSIYDFLGYLFPGALVLILIYFAYWFGGQLSCCCGCLSYRSVSLVDFQRFIGNLISEIKLDETVLFVLVAYVLGHLAAYASCLTVERLTIWLYGYPSQFLLGEEPKIGKPLTKKYWKESISKFRWNNFCIHSWKFLVLLFLLPITFCCYFLGYLFNAQSLYIRSLDNYLVKLIELKARRLFYKLGGDRNIDLANSKCDYHRIIYNYEYEIKEAHRHKMDNYVALYGFMRALTFISNTIFMVGLIYIIFARLPLRENWLFLLFFMLLSYFLFMAFMKFYRRFTLESFMCLATDEGLGDIPDVPTIFTK